MSSYYSNDLESETVQSYEQPPVYENSFPFLNRFAQRQAEGHRLAQIRRLETADLMEAMMWMDPNNTALQSNMGSCPLYLCDTFSPNPILISPACDAYRKNEELMQELAEQLDLDFEIPQEGNLI